MPSHDDDPIARVTRTEVEVPSSPEEAWEAIATSAGHAAWLFPADVDGREGGTIEIHRRPFGPDATATVTAWEPPHRLAYREPVQAPGGEARQLATEFLVEARSGGTCVVRVVSGIHRDAGGWEDLIEGAGEGWRMSLTVLRAYLTHFAGQPVARLDATGSVGRPAGDRPRVSDSLFGLLGLAGRKAGDPYRAPADAPPLAGVVEDLGPGYALVRSAEPGPGLFAISTLPMDGVTASVNVLARLYGPGGADVARREQPRWDAWLADLAPGLPS